MPCGCRYGRLGPCAFEFVGAEAVLFYLRGKDKRSGVKVVWLERVGGFGGLGRFGEGLANKRRVNFGFGSRIVFQDEVSLRTNEDDDIGDTRFGIDSQ
jgi:hypothetical protein